MTLYREIPCEHGFLTDHQKSSEGRKDIQYPHCPGGSRKEVVIDYGAALAELDVWAYEAEGIRDSLTATKAIVDAALGETG